MVRVLTDDQKELLLKLLTSEDGSQNGKGKAKDK
jgi:hypothetical protein